MAGGDQKHWFNGLPLEWLERSDQSSAGLKYWFNGLPEEQVFAPQNVVEFIAVPLSSPVRRKIAPALAIALMASGAITPPIPPFGETIYEDKWHQPWSTPVRTKPRLPAALNPYEARNPTSAADVYIFEPRYPNLIPAKKRVAQNQYEAWSTFTPVPAVVPTWFEPQYPAKIYPKRGLRASDQPAQPVIPPAVISQPVASATFTAAYFPRRVQYQVYTSPVALTGESIFEDKWHFAWSEPIVKSKARLRTGANPYFFFTPAPPFGETIFEDKWHYPWSTPVRVKARLGTGLQRFDFRDPFPLPTQFYTATMYVLEPQDIFNGLLLESDAAYGANVDIHEIFNIHGNVDLVEQTDVFARVTITEV